MAELLERPRRDGALRRHQPDVARNFTPPEEIQQRRSEPRLHQYLSQEVFVVVAADAHRQQVAGLAEQAPGLAVDAELHGRRVVAEQQQLVAELDRHRLALLHDAAEHLAAVGDDAELALRRDGQGHDHRTRHRGRRSR